MAAASTSAITAVVVMAALSSALAGQLFLVGVRAVGVTRAAIFVNLVPALTAGLAAVVLDERIELAQVIGGAAVLAGVWWTTRGAVGRTVIPREMPAPARRPDVAELPTAINQ